MRNNQPVTQHEFDFPASESLMSATDLHGKIIYVNPAFARVCKYLPSEMVGQPHNLIRHPDVPEQAYKDLWDNLEHGRFWTGLLKNRCKDGDFYWVRANVTPVYQGGKMVGYLSVRVKPTREEIAAAEKAYAGFRSGRSKLRFHAGQLIRVGLLGWVDRVRALSMRWQLWGVLAFLAAAWAALATAVGLTGREWWLVTASAVLACAVTGALVDFRFVRRLKPVMRQAWQAATGQTLEDRRLQSLDEAAVLQRAIIQSNLNMHTFIADVDRLIDNLRHAAGEIADGSQHVSTQAETAAHRLADTAQAMGELAETVERNADSTRQATDLARTAGTSMTHAADMVRGTAQSIEQMNAASKKIEDIVGVINGIAFQTNILALNAAVEAARAGEAGRGFAVVAGEVRTLAQRSATSAREIGDIIREVVELAQRSAAHAHETVGAMEETLAQNAQVGQLIDGIAGAGAQQAQGLERVKASLVELNQLTENNASLAEESSAATQSVEEQIRVLATAVDIFHHTRSAAAPVAAAVPPRAGGALQVEQQPRRLRA